MSRPLRVGSVPYLVGRPVDLTLGEEADIEFGREEPARLVEGLREGRLDVALVSSIELFRRPGYSYIAGPCVAGHGYVGSVQVFLRRPLGQVETIAMDPASRTAATLVRCMLAGRDGGAPRYIELERGSDPARAETDAWLSIGDRALRDVLAPDALPVFNPSEEWAAREGRPFVFAAWIIAPGVDIEPHLPAFRRASDAGQARIEDLARQASVDWNIPEDAAHTYLARECTYDVGSEMHAAMLAFRDLAAPLGLCEADLIPEPVTLSTTHA
ncbi:MAG: chorismate dehydratase [Chlamydiales bacterium]|jgi:chorismate dehydratase